MGKLWSVKPSDVDGLATATNNAAPGDEVRLLAGVHRIATAAKSAAIRLNTGVTLSAEAGAEVKLTGNGCFAVAVNATDVRVDGVRVGWESPFVGNFASAFVFRGCRSVLVTNCRVDSAGASAVVLCQGAGKAPDGRSFDNLGEGWGPTEVATVQNCHFYGCVGPVVGMKPGGARHVIVAGNFFFGYGTYAINAEAEGQPDGVAEWITISDNEIFDGNTRWRGDTVGPLFAISVEGARNVRILRNKITSVRGDSASFAAGVCVTTSPSQSDLATSDVLIERNRFESILGSGKGRTAAVLLLPGNQSIAGVTIVRNGHFVTGVDTKPHVRVLALRAYKSKSAGYVYALDSDDPVTDPDSVVAK